MTKDKTANEQVVNAANNNTIQKTRKQMGTGLHSYLY